MSLDQIHQTPIIHSTNHVIADKPLTHPAVVEAEDRCKEVKNKATKTKTSRYVLKSSLINGLKSAGNAALGVASTLITIPISGITFLSMNVISGLIFSAMAVAGVALRVFDKSMEGVSLSIAVILSIGSLAISILRNPEPRTDNIHDIVNSHS